MRTPVLVPYLFYFGLFCLILQSNELIIMRLFFFVICLFWHSVAFCQIPKSAEVDYYDFDIMTVASIKPKTYDESYYGRYNHIRINDIDSLAVLNGIISTLCDTISQPHLPDTIKIASKGEKMRIERYPKIDVRGKIFLDYGNSKCEIIYFSNGIVWNSTRRYIISSV